MLAEDVLTWSNWSLGSNSGGGKNFWLTRFSQELISIFSASLLYSYIEISGESRILLYRGQVLSDGVKHILIRYFKSDLHVDERVFSAIFMKLSGSADPDKNL
jgi:hypothetical protein